MMQRLGESSVSVRKRLGRRARNARLARGRSQSDIARAAGVSLPTLQRFEAGANVSADVLVRVAFVLGSGAIISDLFPLPELRTIEDVLERRRLPKRGRSR